MTQDIKHGWKNVARRMQSVAKSEGLSIISINVLVNKEGDTVLWTSPKQVKIEPKKSRDAIAQLITDLK